MSGRQELISNILQYDPKSNIPLINKAIDLAIKYHGDQLRDSGEPYYSHPLEVAKIVASIRLDSLSIITAILHDTIEDTELTFEDIEREFSLEVATLVDGVTKLTKIEMQAESTRQAENLRKLLLAMSNDIRVLIVKLADRLHNMRTIDFIKSEDKRRRIAIETMEIYAPLAERIGLQTIKLELQDISFKVLNFEIRDSILKRLKQVSADGKEAIDSIVVHIKDTLVKENIKAEVYGRQKAPYSIWMKMNQKNISFDQLSDIIAFRILVDNLPDCYRALGAIHSNYIMVPENFQDFISTPKSNGYRSIHTVVMGPNKQKIEIQIRTWQMHEISEFGVAAHWCYKQGYKSHDGKQYKWIRELLNIIEQTNDPEEFLQNTKLAMYYDQVFCFTPKGALIGLPKGATPIDFAYAVHSNIGHYCVGCKVNGRIVPLKTVLSNGDQVEIIVSKNQTPSPAWEKFSITGRAKSEIKKFIKGQQRQEYINLGKSIFEKYITEEDLGDVQSNIKVLLTKLSKKSEDDIYISIGEGSVTKEDILKILKNFKIPKLPSPLSFLRPGNKNQKAKEGKVPIKGMIPGVAINFAGCCHPLPGDKIIGISHTGKGLTVHTSDCEMLSSFASIPNRILELTWDSDSNNIPFICRIKAVIINQLGSLATLSTSIAQDKGNIINLRVANRTNDFFEMIIDIEVAGIDHMNRIINSLKSYELIHSVERFKF